MAGVLLEFIVRVLARHILCKADGVDVGAEVEAYLVGLFLARFEVKGVSDDVVGHVSGDQRVVGRVNHKRAVVALVHRAVGYETVDATRPEHVQVDGIPTDLVSATHPVKLNTRDLRRARVASHEVAAVTGEIIRAAVTRGRPAYFASVGRGARDVGAFGVGTNRVSGLGIGRYRGCVAPNDHVSREQRHLRLVLAAGCVVRIR
mmetsp:Transcript_4274/g.17643  ORF Transcript_4274/g.17643 Transcript_4274/m.17643 type:complete len:204 (-) Transcript_4274:787-1398(-)